MSSNDGQPVIIGAGLSGLAISRTLSAARIPHLLVGTLPDSTPRLGESIDPAGSVALLEFFPEYGQHYHLKRYVSVYSGNYAAICDFKGNRTRSFGLRRLGFGAGDEFIHVDRIGFDRAFAADTVASPLCTHADLRVEALRYDEASDRLWEIELSDGRVLRPGWVFDATNHVRLVARAAGVALKWVSDLQRVVFRHYRMPAATPCDRDAGGWRHCTSLLRLYRRWDGIDAFAWCIPLGSYVSLGGSMKVDDNDLDDETAVERIADAYARRGLEIREQFCERSQVVAIRNRYFMHERAYGGNWLLAGPSFGQVWFPTSSGVGSALLAAAVAPRVLAAPGRLGRAYQAYVEALARSHALFDEMIARDADLLSAASIKKVAEEIVAENVKRVARLAAVHGGRLARGWAWLVRKLAVPPLSNAGWQVFEGPLEKQTAALFEPR